MSAFRDYDFAERFALRTPLLPYETFVGWADGLAGESTAAPTDHEIGAQRQELRRRLVALVNSRLIGGVLVHASRSLKSALAQWMHEPAGADARKTERSLTKYLTRICTRPTPFGVFSALSEGRIGAETAFELAGPTACKVHARVSTSVLFDLAAYFDRQPAIRKQLTYQVNPTLYKLGFQARYYGFSTCSGRRRYELRTVEYDDVLATVRRAASEGTTLARLCDELRVALGDDASDEDLAAYVDELVEQQILVSSLAPSLCGSDIHGQLIADLRAIVGVPQARQAARCLENADAFLANVTTVWGVAGARDRALEMLRSLPCPIASEQAIAVDLVRPSPRATIAPSTLSDVKKGLDGLHRLAPAVVRSPLQDFRRAFVEQFGERTVRLAVALDPDTGPGFPAHRSTVPSGLLADLQLGSVSSPLPTTAWGATQVLLLRKLQEATAGGLGEIELTQEELQALPGPKGVVPDSMHVKFHLESCGESASQVWLDHATGPGAGRLVARFAESVPELARSMARADHAKGSSTVAVKAEVVHVPPLVAGDVLCRPAAHSVEIDVLGGRAAADRTRLPIDDLAVGVEGNRVVLWSTRLNKRVEPILSNAHEFRVSHNLPVYRFLCAMQSQGQTTTLQFRWGPLEHALFLPRVRIGRVVVSPARWTMSNSDRAAAIGAKGNDKIRRVRAWRNRVGCPRIVGLLDGHYTLPIDFENVMSVEAVLSRLGAVERVTFVELPNAHKSSPVRDKVDSYRHEIIMALARVRVRAPHEPANRERPDGRGSSLCMPDAPPRWLSARLLCGPSQADDALLKGVVPALAQLRGVGPVRWFFVRYAVPRWHVRLRILADEHQRSVVRETIDAMALALRRQGAIDEHIWDVYEPETSRYGGAPGMSLAHRWFALDSATALKTLDLEDEHHGQRWCAALVGIDQILSAFGFGLARKQEFSGRMRERLVGGRDRDRVRRALAMKYRTVRTRVEALIAREAELGPYFGALKTQRPCLEGIGAEVLNASRTGQLIRPLPELAASYVHMHVNRLIPDRGVDHELTLYDFIHRASTSALKRRGARGGRQVVEC